jgi:hypothetical protein
MKKSLTLVFCCIALIIVACLDVTSPPGGIGSFTNIIQPSPSVVVGSDMRDSTGAVAPLRVVVFGANGDTLTGVEISFLSIDTTKPPAVTVTGNGIVHGDSVRANVAGSLVVANVGGRFQTVPDTLRVTVPPDRSRKEDQPLLTLTLVPPTDSLATVNQRPLKLTVSGSLPAGAKGAPADTFAVGFIVDYRIVSAPASTSAGRAVRLLNDNNKDATRDTTSASDPGVAILKLQFNPAFFSDQALLGGTKTDTVKVEVTVHYNGQAAAQTPSTFVVPIKVGP